MAAGDPGTRKRNYSATAIETKLAAGITSAAQGDTTTGVLVNSVSGFPSILPYTIIIDPDTNKEEVATVTAASSTTLTIVRGQDNTQAVAHSANAAVRHGVSAREFKELQTHIAARGVDLDSALLSGVDSHVHGLVAGDGQVVGSTQSVTLTRKTLTTPVINGATVTGTVTSSANIDMTGGTITGLSSSGMVTSSATPKSYVDAILGSATAASTSATSAATSATSAAASAVAAATSATSASNSATAAATSAASALVSQTAAATSAASALTSQTAAATSAASALTSQTAAATSAASASTSATSAQAWATQLVTPVSGTDYSAKYNANLSATSATASATSAGNAATSASSALASQTAAATSAASAAASQTAAATSATSAAASATAAATSAASALVSQTAAATSAASALTSQTAAATSATSAAASATAAATSATSAATSATSAATTYTAYDQRYLGSKSSAPTLDNQGNALLVGATYWSTSLNNMYVWSGSTWIQIATTSVYTAPTLGSTTLASGTTYSTVSGLTLSSGLATADPTTALGLATKQYVDLVTASVNYHAPVVAASTTNLGVTYSNGTNGVGATLTADTLRAFNTLDGQSVSVGQRVLIKDQTTQLQNGVYTLTNNGVNGTTAWILTRATDNDATPEIANGDVINVTGGTVNSGKTFVNSSAASITVGTTAITFASYYTGLPAQGGNAGFYLTTDGTTPSWAAVNLSAYALATTESDNTLLALMGAY